MAEKSSFSSVAMKEKFKELVWPTKKVVAAVETLLWAESATCADPSLDPDFPSFPSSATAVVLQACPLRSRCKW